MLFITTIKNQNIKNYLQVANNIVDKIQVIDKGHIELVYKAVVYLSLPPILMTRQETGQLLFEYDMTDA